MPKGNNSLNRLVHLLHTRPTNLRPRGYHYREIQLFINGFRERVGEPPLTDEGDPDKPYFRAKNRMNKAGRETEYPHAIDWAEKMYKNILSQVDENGNLPDSYVWSFSAGCFIDYRSQG